jgi:hypothetical protein
VYFIAYRDKKVVNGDVCVFSWPLHWCWDRDWAARRATLLLDSLKRVWLRPGTGRDLQAKRSPAASNTGCCVDRRTRVSTRRA